ncbi:MAG TPA: isochorismatase family cysteine hydrolase [Clostridia bacterium]|nr:isochorismatase family cysteine hydrolase [Clostridia bacterium]
MEYPKRKDFLDKSSKTLEGMLDMLENLPVLELSELEPEKTALVVIDMINGFAREGALKSPRVEALIPVIAKLSEECCKRGIARLMFADNHTGASPEFKAYPVHCMKGTSESELVDELKTPGGYGLIPKNSTNGFIEENFMKWLKENSSIKNYIITGDCTDICIQQFAVTLKTWFNRLDEASHVIVPVNAVDTFDLGLHDGDLLNVVTLFSMAGNGVELVSRIRQ